MWWRMVPMSQVCEGVTGVTRSSRNRGLCITNIRRFRCFCREYDCDAVQAAVSVGTVKHDFGGQSEHGLIIIVFAISTRQGGYALRRPISTRRGGYAPPRRVVAISIRQGGIRPSTSCCLCHSDMMRRVHPFSLYCSCYFNMPGWGIPFQCWERTPPSPLPNFPPPCAPPFWRWDSSLTPNFRH